RVRGRGRVRGRVRVRVRVRGRMIRHCTRCYESYPNTAVCCPRCRNPEFSLESLMPPKNQNTIAHVYGNGLKVDAEFRDLIEPCKAEEYTQLQINLVAEGRARDKLTVWEGQNIVLDGHNRLEICDANELHYGVEYLKLPDREACKTWIINNQL